MKSTPPKIGTYVKVYYFPGSKWNGVGVVVKPTFGRNSPNMVTVEILTGTGKGSTGAFDCHSYITPATDVEAMAARLTG